MDIEANVHDRILEPVDLVFDAIVDPARMSRYFISGASGPLRAGSRVEWEFADVGVRVPIDVVEVERNRSIVYESTATGPRTRVTLTLTPVDARATLVAIREAGWPMDREGVQRALGQTAGWTYFLCCLKAYVQHGIDLRQGLTERLTEQGGAPDAVPDRVERVSRVQAPIERVWETLTQARHVAEWYAFDGADIDLRAGGSTVFRWKEHGTFRGRVVEVAAPQRFSLRQAVLAPDEEPRPGNSTLVAFTLERDGDATRVRVVESGIAGLDAPAETRRQHAASAGQAWTDGLGGLRGIAERRPTSEGARQAAP